MTLRVKDLRFAYPQGPAVLRGIDLTVAPGASAFLLGPSGSGKTTLLRAIAGLERAYSGSVSWDAQPLDDDPPHARRIGMLFQEPALFPHLTVLENVAFGLRYRGVTRGDRAREAARHLALVEMESYAASRVDELSGGQRQRVALARTLAAQPRAVLLDEPLSGLDEELRLELGHRVKRLLKEQGVAAVWVTHDRAEAARLADQAWTLVEGRPVEGVHRPTG